MVIMEKLAPRASPVRMSRAFQADIHQNSSMLSLGSFAFACITVFGCVLWACVKDTDQT